MLKLWRSQPQTNAMVHTGAMSGTYRQDKKTEDGLIELGRSLERLDREKAKGVGIRKQLRCVTFVLVVMVRANVIARLIA